jgi:hypothetical protein
MATFAEQLKDLKDNDMFEFGSAVRLVAAALKDAAEGTTKNTQEIEKDIEAKRKEREALQNNSRELNKNTDSLKKLGDTSKKLGGELLKIADAGVKFGTAVGVSATRGVQLEIQNRFAVAAQLKNFGADLAVTVEQLKGAQQGFADSFIGAAEGMQISAQGSIGLVSDLKKGFKSEFEPTAETFRILTQMGMSTTEQFDAFRRATGRASLSNNQLATLYNKNQLSFLLYGNSFAKAAVNAERLGINLASVQAAQEGLVTNLDGTIDTVAQLNQLGANIDFGNLTRIAETEGPDALMAYVRATVPANLMQSASTRALFKQLGISVEDYIKSGGAQQSAADQLEKRMTEAADKTSGATKFISGLGAAASKMSAILTGSFGGLALAAYYAAAALIKVGQSGGLSGMFGKEGFSKLGVGGTIGTGLAGIGTGMAVGTALGGGGTGSLIGSIAGTALGAFFGPAGMMIGGTLGGALGGQIQNMMVKPANDMYSSGYGSRVLVTPKGAFALNNADDIIAGTNLFPKGTLQAGSDNSDLVRKVDKLIDALSNASTTINVGGMSQTVPRLQLVGVYSRNEVR